MTKDKLDKLFKKNFGADIKKLDMISMKNHIL